MKTVIVGSKNPVKVQAIHTAFARMFPDDVFEVEGVSAPSGVSDQPMTDAETKLGAHNRVAAARELAPLADFWAAIEGGVEEHDDTGLHVSAWIVIESKEGKQGKGRTGGFYLPEQSQHLCETG